MNADGGGSSGGGGGNGGSNATRNPPLSAPFPAREHTPPGSALTHQAKTPISRSPSGSGARPLLPTGGRSPSESVGSATPPPTPPAAFGGGGGSPASIASATVSTTSPPSKPPLAGKQGRSVSAPNSAVGGGAGGGNNRNPSGVAAAGAASTAGAAGGSGYRTSGNGVAGGSIAATGVDVALSRAGLVAVLDLCVALYKFVNVELHSQGWYAVRVRVASGPDAVCSAHTVVQSLAPGGPAQYQQGGGQPQASLQTANHRGPQTHGGGGGGGAAADPSGADASQHKRQQGWVVEDGGSSFRSSIFRIRYCYEEVKLQTAVLMQLVVTNLQALPSLALQLDFELLFQEANLENATHVPDEFHLRCVARETVTLEGVAGGLAEYYGCTFSDEHFGLCSSGLFAGVAGYATKDMVESCAQRAVSSNWLCSLVGEGRRDAALHYRPSSSSSDNTPHSAFSSAASKYEGGGGPSTGGGGGRAGGPYGSSPGGGVSISRLSRGPEPLDFSDQELRKKVIRLLHHVVEAPSVKQGTTHIPTESERQERLAAAYMLLVESHRASRDSLAGVLRAAPLECFAPQNLDVLRALLASAAASAAAGGGGGGGGGAPATPKLGVMGGSAAAVSSPLRGATPRAAAAAPLARLSFGAMAAASAAGGGAAAAAAELAVGATHADVPPASYFRDQLERQDLPTTAAALQLMDGLLVALSRDSRTDWAVLGWVLRTVPRELMRHLKLQWERSQPDAVMPFLVWDSSDSARDAIATRAAAHRQELRTPTFPLPAVQPGCLWGTPGEQPVLVVDDSQGTKWLEEMDCYFGTDFRPRDETHVAIFVHGFQGAATDLCLVKAHLMLMYPYLECFSSKTNEGNTHDSIQEMGKRLAVEMAGVLAPFSRSTRRPLRKITLVGHSIGNLILRAALTQPEFLPYKHLLWLYISVCGPHLGFLYGTNAVVDTGLLLLKSIGKGKCLHQLTFSDAPQLTDCYLYRLAHECPLSVFKLVVLVSSPQDRYVPYHSSSITSCPQAERDTRRGRCYGDMLRALLSGVGQGTHLFRLGVDFSLRGKGFSFSKLVGRTAHIEFIESQLYVGLMMWGLVHRYTMLAPSPHSWV